MNYISLKNSIEKIGAGKLVCIGRNYAAHAKELGGEVPETPIIFLKPTSALIQSGENVIHPSITNNLHYETELLLLIGKDVKNASIEEAEAAIIAYGVGFDMTMRDVQSAAIKSGQPWTVSKGFDTSAVVSTFTLKKDYPLTMNEQITLHVNGEVKQNSPLSDMIFPPSELVRYISTIMRLERGDIIFTGTPEGVGKVVPGDKLIGKITSIATVETRIE